MVTTGATEAIAGAMLGLVNPGDEVVVCEPYYDSYRAMIQFAGGVRRPVTLRAPGYRLDADELEAAVTERTRLILLNSPHNPTGRVLDAGELSAVAEVAQRHDLIVVSDEVYEHLTFDDHDTSRSGPCPGCSSGPWRSPALARPSRSPAGRSAGPPGRPIWWQPWRAPRTGCPSPPGRRYSPRSPTRSTTRQPSTSGSATTCPDRRDFLCDGLDALGLEVHVPQGTYFVTTDVSTLGYPDGKAFCTALAARARVVAIPTMAFYEDDSADGRHLIRWAFCKEQEVLAEGSAGCRPPTCAPERRLDRQLDRQPDRLPDRGLASRRRRPHCCQPD